MFSVGIIGLPNVGKSTLFKALTKISVPIANYPFTTIDPHHGVIEVKDKRLEQINKILEPEKTSFPTIEFIDIAGLVKNAHKGEGLGNQFLSNIGEADILLEVVRNFSISTKNINKDNESDETNYQLYEKPNPLRDIEIIKEEILKRDEKIILNAIESKGKKDTLKNSSDKKILYQLLEEIKRKKWLFDYIINKPQEEQSVIGNTTKKIGLISSKPIIYLFNTIKKDYKVETVEPSLCLNIKTEEEISELNEEEKSELEVNSSLDDIIFTCYNKLDLITFYTIKGGKETKATELKKGSSILEAAEKIHSDFRKKFISAEVAKFENFIKYGSWHLLKENGLISIKGKNYNVEDGDIIEFKI